jgi:hypothetical protein
LNLSFLFSLQRRHAHFTFYFLNAAMNCHLLFVLLLFALSILVDSVGGVILSPRHNNNNNNNSAIDEPITCANVDQIHISAHVAAGSIKLISEGHWGEAKVLVVQPHTNGSFYAAAHREADFGAKLAAVFAEERDRLRAVRRDNVVALLGGCFDAAAPERIALVVPYLETWSTAIADDRLGLVARLLIAASALDLARLFDRFPLVDRSNASVVLHETSGRSFGVTGDYQVKLFALADRLIFRNHSRAFGDDRKCDSDDACRAFFATDAGGAFDATQSGAPRDFDCNLAARRCWGLDSRTNVYTICRTMLRPLLALTDRAKVPLALARDRATYGNAATTELQQLMWQCEANNPHDRVAAAALQKGLRALAARFGGDDAEKLPPFEPRNPAASGYVSLQELSKAALTAGALEAAERAAAALVANDIVVRLPNGTSGRRQWLKEHLDPNGDLEGSVDSLGRWHPHAEFYNPPIVLSDWFFRLALSPEAASSPERPVVRLAGVAGEQSWLSSPVRHWISARELATTNGKRYILHGAVDCKGLKSVGFADRMCALFRDGFPRDWLAVMQPVWDQLKKSAEAQQLLDDALLPPQLGKLDGVDPERSGERPTPRPTHAPTPKPTRSATFHCRGNRHKCEQEFRKWQAEHGPAETSAPPTTPPAPPTATAAPAVERPPSASVACFQFKTCLECNEPRRWHRMDLPSECAWCPSVRACVARSSVLQTCPAPLLDAAVCETDAPTPSPTPQPTPQPTPTPHPHRPPRRRRPSRRCGSTQRCAGAHRHAWPSPGAATVPPPPADRGARRATRRVQRVVRRLLCVKAGATRQQEAPERCRVVTARRCGSDFRLRREDASRFTSGAGNTTSCALASCIAARAASSARERIGSILRASQSTADVTDITTEASDRAGDQQRMHVRNNNRRQSADNDNHNHGQRRQHHRQLRSSTTTSILLTTLPAPPSCDNDAGAATV